MTIKRRLIFLIIISLCIRLLIAYSLQFGNDEAYYYTYALHLQWNYFDHPSGVALLIKLSTLNLWLTNEVFVRLGAVLCAAAGTFISYKTGLLIRNERTGFYAAILYNTSIYTSIIAGIFILPDSPQVVCWLAALYVLLTIVIRYEKSGKASLWQWLWFGLLSGVCIECKVHGIFLWAGIGLYVLFYKPKMLLQPGLYLSFLVMLIIISPIILWNINNHFITYTYHSNRVAVQSFTVNFSSFFQAFFGQIFYNNPLNVFIIVAAIFSSYKKQLFHSSIHKILLLTGLPVILVVTAISLFNAVLPHWSGPGFLALSFIAAAYLDETKNTASASLPLLLKSSAVLIIIIIVCGTAVIEYYPGSFGKKDSLNYGSGDFTLDMNGWTNFDEQYHAWIAQQKYFNNYSKLKIVCNKWFPAAHIEYYIARPEHTAVVGVGSLNDLHNFAWLNKERTDLIKGDDALTIVPSNYSINAEDTYKNTFSSVIKLHTFTAVRSGKTARYFTVYLLKNYQPADEVHRIIVQ